MFRTRLGASLHQNPITMKKHLFIALIILLSLPSMAQVARIRPQHHGNSQHSTTLTLIAPRDLHFWLFIDDVLQNENAVHSICIRNLQEDSYYIRVELDNQQQNCVGQFIDMSRSQTLSIIQSNKLFGLDATQMHLHPELTMDLVTLQPYDGGNGQPPMPPGPPMAFGMNPQDYDEAYQLISKESFDSSKLTLAKQVVSSNPMTASQILGICKLFSFESNKLEFAKYAYAFCVEPNKYYLLNDAFSYDSSKRELDEYINGH